MLASTTDRPITSGVDRPDALSDALSDAEAALAAALAQPSSDPETVAAGLLDLASRLLAVASDVCSVADGGVDGRRQSAAALPHELEFLENAILEGELKYQLDTAAMSCPLDRASRTGDAKQANAAGSHERSAAVDAVVRQIAERANALPVTGSDTD